MKAILKTLLLIVGIIILILSHQGVSFLLPHPFNKINVIAGFITLFIIVRETGVIVWISILLHIFLELYAVTPFGSILFPAVMSTLATYWIHRDVITNRSWIAAATLTGILLFFFRIGYTILASLAQMIETQTVTINYRDLSVTFLWELLLTSVMVSLIYIVLSIFIKKLKTRIIYT